MFPTRYFPNSYFPPSYWPKAPTGRRAAGHGNQVLARRHVLQSLERQQETAARKREGYRNFLRRAVRPTLAENDRQRTDRAAATLAVVLAEL